MIINYFKWIKTEDLYGLYTDKFRNLLKDECVNMPMEAYLNQLPENLPIIEKDSRIRKKIFIRS